MYGCYMLGPSPHDDDLASGLGRFGLAEDDTAMLAEMFRMMGDASRLRLARLALVKGFVRSPKGRRGVGYSECPTESQGTLTVLSG